MALYSARISCSVVQIDAQYNIPFRPNAFLSDSTFEVEDVGTGRLSQSFVSLSLFSLLSLSVLLLASLDTVFVSECATSACSSIFLSSTTLLVADLVFLTFVGSSVSVFSLPRFALDPGLDPDLCSAEMLPPPLLLMVIQQGRRFGVARNEVCGLVSLVAEHEDRPARRVGGWPVRVPSSS
jgi:hypothetical protein